MDSIGAHLRQRREQLGLTLDEAERVTRIRAHYLQALEQDELEALPSAVQARGFLKNYADYLGLPPKEILQRFADQAGPRRRLSRLQAAPIHPAARPGTFRRRWFSMDLLVAAVISVGTLALLMWGGGRLMTSLRLRTEQAQESAFLIPTGTASPSPVPSAAPIAASTQPASEPTVTSTLPPLPLPSGRVILRLIAEQRAWVRVLVDGRLSFQGRIAPGDVKDYSGDRIVEVSTGNGAGIRISWNGQDQGLMGGLDEVVTRLWTSAAMLTPTSTISPTTTSTVPPSATPSPSPTRPEGG